MGDPDRLFELQLTDQPDSAVRDQLGEALVGFNTALLGPPDIRPLVVVNRDPDGGIAGGLWGRTGFGWLFVELLFVPDRLRSLGLGNAMLDLAENEARKRGCRGAWLDTLSQDARRFYEARGYRLFGQLGDYPEDNSRCFLCKRFDGR